MAKLMREAAMTLALAEETVAKIPPMRTRIYPPFPIIIRARSIKTVSLAMFGSLYLRRERIQKTTAQ